MALPESRRVLSDLIAGPHPVPFHTDKDWDEVADAVWTWFVDLKHWESQDTFNDAFAQSRMTIRAIQVGRQSPLYEPDNPNSKEFYTEPVTKVKGVKGVEGKDRQIKQMQGVPGVQERMNPNNFMLQGPEIRTLKNEKGLHDTSAGLLNPRRPLRIGGPTKPGEGKAQLHRYSGRALWVFMPVPNEEDLTLFYQMNELSKKPGTGLAIKAAMRVMGSRLTRIKVAFENDAGLCFLDVAPEGDAYGKFRYGHTGLNKAKGMKTGTQLTDQEIAERKLAARRYKTVLGDDNENEIVVAYRQHGLSTIPSRFPVYAFYNDDGTPDRRLTVVRAEAGKYTETGQHISESGILH